MISNGKLTDIFSGSEGFHSQQNVNNEIGILKSFNLNYRVMQKLPEFWVVYTSVERGIAETRMYKTCPFTVVYDSLESQVRGQRIDIRVLSDSKYLLKINSGKNFEKELSFGQRFNNAGYDFIIDLRNQDEYNYDPDGSNRYYFYFTDPVALANQYRGRLLVTPIVEDASLVTLTTTGMLRTRR